MLIVCPSCATSYDVQPASLEPNGRQVRCVRCRTVWHAVLDQADRLRAAADALATGPDVEPPAAEVPVGAWTEAEGEENTAGMAGEAGSLDRPLGRGPAEASAPHASADELDPQPPRTVDTADPSSEPLEVEAPSVAPVDFDADATPVDDDVNAAVPPGPVQDDIETFAARVSRRRAKRAERPWSLTRLQIATLALLVVDSILVGWRTDIVRLLPQTASLYAAMGLPVNVRGLSFDQVVTSMEAHEGVPILVVQGNIVNDTGSDIEVPRLKLELRNDAKQEVYAWTVAPPQARLSAYQAASFHVRLASPPPEGRDVLMRFLTRRDIVADTR